MLLLLRLDPFTFGLLLCLQGGHDVNQSLGGSMGLVYAPYRFGCFLGR